MNKTKSTRYRAVVSEINFKEIISETVHCLQQMENAHKLQIDITIEGLLPFYNDKEQLQIVFNNIISNAIKFQHIHEANPKLKIHIEIDGEKALMLFADNGIGIPKEAQSKVYDMFYRLPGTKADGAGLGMFMVKDIIKKLKGKIKLQSEINVGTTFKIEVPNRINPDLLRQMNRLIDNSK